VPLDARLAPLKRDLKVVRPGAPRGIPGPQLDFCDVFDVINLKAIGALCGFGDAGNGGLGLRGDTKRSYAHFEPTSRSKMRVAIAIQAVASRGVVDHISDAQAAGLGAVDGSNSQKRNKPAAKNYDATKELVGLMDDFVDICNTRQDTGCGAVSSPADPQLNKLLTIVDFFYGWREVCLLPRALGVPLHLVACACRTYPPPPPHPPTHPHTHTHVRT
jgi:hypothetical protein